MPLCCAPEGQALATANALRAPRCAVHPGQWGGWSLPLQTWGLLTMAQMMTGESMGQGETQGKCEGRGKMGWTVTVWL